ncbi:unnamed protein product, partial [Rotaria sp. Silwood2]
MDTSNNNNLNILDLPDEILLIIFNKLNRIDALYSLVDVNKRFNRLVLNSLHIRNLDTTSMVIKSYYDRRFSIDNNILLKICEKILPRIHHQLNELIVEQNSVKHILLTGYYLQLDSLSLVNFQKEILFQYLTGALFFPSTSCTSSTLIKLKVNVATFDDCLYLLDGRLKHLSTLIIHVKKISLSFSDKNKKKLPELKCFSLTSTKYTSHYSDQIIPLLRRMINLKELTLFLSVFTNDCTYIDGIQLHDQILIYMPQLNKFTFSINSNTVQVEDVVNEDIEIDLPSNEDIQRSFIGKGYGQ